MEIRRLGPGDEATVLGGGALFDGRPRLDWTSQFLDRDGTHLLMAFDGDLSVGFVTGVEIPHPDKGVEMLLYELGVAESHRRRGIGRSLVERLVDIARSTGCRGMWVPIDAGDEIAAATYRSAGGSEPGSAAIVEWDLTG